MFLFCETAACSKYIMAEGAGFEPARPCGRWISSPLPYQLGLTLRAYSVRSRPSFDFAPFGSEPQGRRQDKSAVDGPRLPTAQY